jgi:uncharacterized protein YggE
MIFRSVVPCLLICSCITFAQEQQRELPATPIIVVTGSGETDVQPDQAVLSLGAVAQDKDAASAQKKVSEVIQKSLDALMSLGIKPEKIHTQRITLRPIYHQSAPNGTLSRRKIVGYEASNTLQITLDDLTQIGPAIDTGVAAGADNIEGVDFQLIDDTAATQDALKRATIQARAKAQSIADALGEHLGPAAEVVEGGVQRVMPMMAMASMAVESEAVSTPVQPGQIKISAQVTVTYRIK